METNTKRTRYRNKALEEKGDYILILTQNPIDTS